MKRHRLGTWSMPSGNSVDVDVIGEGSLRQIAFFWDRLPLTIGDEVFYETVILPAVIRRSSEYLELVGPALVVVA